MGLAHAADWQLAASLVPALRLPGRDAHADADAPERGSDRGAVGGRSILPVRHP